MTSSHYDQILIFNPFSVQNLTLQSTGYKCAKNKSDEKKSIFFIMHENQAVSHQPESRQTRNNILLTVGAE